MVQSFKHKHHIIPKHRGGSDDSSNLVEVSVTQHAMWHYAEWQLNGDEWDRIAWLGLAGISTCAEIVKKVQIEAGKRCAQEGLGFHTPERRSAGGKVGGRKGGKVIHEMKNEEGKSQHGLRCAEILHRTKNDQGKSAIAVESMEKLHAEKTEEGKSVHALRCLEKIHSVKDENGKSVVGVKLAKNTNSQKWMCLTTGYISNPGALSRYQRKRGLSTGAENRVKLEKGD